MPSQAELQKELAQSLFSAPPRQSDNQGVEGAYLSNDDRADVFGREGTAASPAQAIAADGGSGAASDGTALAATLESMPEADAKQALGEWLLPKVVACGAVSAPPPS